MDDDEGVAGARVTRWVQYDVPMLVRVDQDENGDADIAKIVLVADGEFIHPFRDMTGQYRVYDGDFNEIADDLRIDGGIRGAVSVAEDFRHRYPLFPMGDRLPLDEVWEVGPSPAIDPDYYLTEAELEALDAAFYAEERVDEGR